MFKWVVYRFISQWGVSQRFLIWLTVLTNLLLFSILNMVLTFLWPNTPGPRASGAEPNPFRVMLAINAVAAAMACLIAPYLIRTIDRMHQRMIRQNNELRSLHAIDNAITSELNLDLILEMAVREATLAVDGELGALWVLDEYQGIPVAQEFFNVPVGARVMLRELITSGDPSFAGQMDRPHRRENLDARWRTERTSALLNLRNMITIPIKWNNAPVGLFMIGNRGDTLNPDQGFTDDDQDLLTAVASTVAVAVHNARMYEETQRKGDTLRTLVARTGEAIAASTDTPRLMQVLADESWRLVGCERVAVYAVDLVHGRLLPLAAHDEATPEGTGPPDFYQQSLPLDCFPRYQEAASPEAEREHGRRYVPDVRRELSIRDGDAAFLSGAGLIFGLRSRDQQPIGLLLMLDSRGRPQPPDTMAFASALAAQAAVALENARLVTEQHAMYQREKRIAERFQLSLLPQVPERIGSFEFAQKYQAGLAEAEIGGDIFDLFTLDADRAGVMMADVSGKGLDAAVQTAMIKYTLRAIAQEAPGEPGLVLERVNNVLRSGASGLEGFVTVFYAVLNTATGELLYTNGGHEPPLVLRARTGTASPLDLTGGMALGCLSGVSYGTQSLTMEPGDSLLLFTDGLTEARSEENQFLGSEGLAAIFSEAHGAAQDVVDTVFERVRVFADDNLRDDVAMLLVRRRGEG